MASPSPIRATTNATQWAIEKRRARNRISQKSFRERQSLHVRQLERQLAEVTRDESARLRSSQVGADRLRKALLTTRKRIRGLATALTSLVDDIGVALDLENNLNQDSQADNEHFTDPCGESCLVDEAQSSALPLVVSAASHTIHDMKAQEHPVGSPKDLQASSSSAAGFAQEATMHAEMQQSEELEFTYGPPSSSHRPPVEEVNGQRVPEDSNMQSVLASLDASWYLQSKEFQTTLPAMVHPYPHIAPSCGGPSPPTYMPEITFPPGNPTFPSTFSAHLATCEFFIRQNKIYKQRHLSKSSDAFGKLISNMVNMFINTAWPEMRVWWAYMQSSAAVEKIMRWRLDPCLESYEAMKECHRPTAIQLTVVHPTIIDWLFFPSLRDRVIQLYSCSWLLDQLMCEVLTAYVVEADLSKLITDLGDALPKRGYFRIWDLVQTISREDADNETATEPNLDLMWQDPSLGVPPSPFQLDEDESEGEWTPMPLAQIFCSRSAAIKLFKLLHMDDRRSVKLDPSFACKYPELCADPSILAQGLDCTLKTNEATVPLPKPMTRATIQNYKMMLWKTVT